MTGPEKIKTKAKNEGQLLTESVATSNLVKEVLDAEIQNIIHDIVLKAHRQHRTEQDARPQQRADDSSQKPKHNLSICPSCKLPRLFYPTKGIGSRPPPDPSLTYCANAPPIKMPGHDVNGNPFATDKPPYKSKMKKSQKAEQAAAAATSPGPSQHSGSPPQSPTEGSFNGGPTSAPNDKDNGNKTVVSFPERKCPNCPRYLVVTKMARHLDRCLGISGRQSARNAVEKMGTGTGNTPTGSRAGTPSVTNASNGPKKRAAEDESPVTAGDSVKKKKLKLSSPKKKEAPSVKEKKGSALKNGETIGETVIAVKKED